MKSLNTKQRVCLFTGAIGLSILQESVFARIISQSDTAVRILIGVIGVLIIVSSVIFYKKNEGNPKESNNDLIKLMFMFILGVVVAALATFIL